MKWWQYVLFGFMIWSQLGFVTGAINSAIERDNSSYKPNGSGGFERVDESHSGCIYMSWAAFTNPGYIIGCEMFRRRFALEGIIK